MIYCCMILSGDLICNSSVLIELPFFKLHAIGSTMFFKRGHLQFSFAICQDAGDENQIVINHPDFEIHIKCKFLPKNLMKYFNAITVFNCFRPLYCRVWGEGVIKIILFKGSFIKPWQGRGVCQMSILQQNMWSTKGVGPKMSKKQSRRFRDAPNKPIPGPLC